MLVVLSLVIVSAVVVIYAVGSGADITGAGTADDPYLIYTAKGLKTFGDIVNGQNGQTKQPDACAKLMADIVLNDGTFDENGSYTKGASGKDAEEWTPIGYYKTADYSEYAGTFDGGGHTVKGLYVTGAGQAGLFGYVSSATIKNVTVDGYVCLNSDGFAGGIVGWMSNAYYGARIENCVNLCHVVADDPVEIGGIVGEIVGGEILNCANLGTISAAGQTYRTGIGGIAGRTSGATLIDCYNAGKVMSRGDLSNHRVGGIVGDAYSQSTITNCYNVGKVSKETWSSYCYVGGIAGRQDRGAIKNCYWLSGTAEKAVDQIDDGTRTNVAAKSKAEFSGGDVLELLKGGRTDSPWTKIGYLAAADMLLPMFSWQTADTMNITGTGTADDPYLIYTAEGLRTFRDKVNSGEVDAFAKLMDNIDLGNKAWTPIANYTGTFDGNGKTIKGINVTGVTNAGLFGLLSGSAVVKNLTVAGSVEASNINGDAYAGSITAKISGNVQIIDCVNNAAVKATVNNDVDIKYIAYAGGMAGRVDGSVRITRCTNNGAVVIDSIRANAHIGGMAGHADGSVVIENCLNAADLSADASGSRYLSDGTTETTYVTANPYAGGMVGYADGVTVTGCYNTGAVTTRSTGDYSQQPSIGGMLGRADNNVTITNSGNTGKITAIRFGAQTIAGGIVGAAAANNGTFFTISYCYSTGEVPSDHPQSWVGGIAGLISQYYGSTLNISDCYWLTGSCGNGVGKNIDSAASVTKVEALSKTEFALKDGVRRLLTVTALRKLGYVAAADMTLPLLEWQTADSHVHNQNGILGGCTCGVLTHTGDETDPYPISTAEDLKTFRDLASHDPSICAKLINDIDLGGEQWTPIGNSDVYAGIFDGNGKTIRGLNVTGVENAGLFGRTIEATIRNLAVDGTVSGLKYAGGIVGMSNYGTTIEGCVNLCRVSASGYSACAGGIVGYLYYTVFSSSEPPNSIKNCANFGEISVGGADYGIYAGGIVGCMDPEDSPITGCYSVGKVSGSSKSADIGGIYGFGMKDRSYYLIDTVQGDLGYSATTKAKFANDVLALLQNGDASSPWTKTGYVASVGMTLPLLNWQTADSHTCNFEWKHTDTEHWKECDCSLIEAGSKAAHSGTDDGDCTTAVVCECGYVITGAEATHTWTNWASCGNGKHERHCTNSGCETYETENCHGGTATCKEQATCSICGEKYGDIDPDNHTGSKEWTIKNETEHEQKYSCCGKTMVAKESHNWENGVCTECGYGCAHKGGTSTCTEQATCSICREKYGDIDPDNHTGSKEWTIKNETEHEQKYSCCGKTTVAKEAHEWKNGTCTECGYVCGHKGGTATCTEQATCSICCEKYGNIDHNNHVNLRKIPAVAATVEAKGSIEYFVCDDCKKLFADEKCTKKITLADTITEKAAPTIISGADSKWYRYGKNEYLEFRSDALYADFISVSVDGKLLDELQYEKSEGSIIIRLKADYLNSILIGKHTISITSVSGDATATFAVSFPDADVPTGDSFIICLAAFAAGLSGLIALAAVCIKRRKLKA